VPCDRGSLTSAEALTALVKDNQPRTRTTFATASIRGQKTRWGSCSSRQTISVNCKLLFLPSELVRYVLIHELCHTVHLNHSAAFWALVAQKEPDYQQLDAGLRDARYHVPLWLEA
jgi:predicted metal-dependent hydrolase